MADVQVTCITKPHPQSPHEHITHLGNPEMDPGAGDREHRSENQHFFRYRPLHRQTL
jgi:hypothetical protein